MVPTGSRAERRRDFHDVQVDRDNPRPDRVWPHLMGQDFLCSWIPIREELQPRVRPRHSGLLLFVQRLLQFCENVFLDVI